ncbi:hypothetical protein DOY81_001081, partial [Sarcophaga bullata]
IKLKVHGNHHQIKEESKEEELQSKRKKSFLCLQMHMRCVNSSNCIRNMLEINLNKIKREY